MTHSSRIETAIARVEELTAQVKEAKFEAKKASLAERTARKADLAELGMAALNARQNASDLSDALKAAQEELKDAKKASIAAAKEEARESAKADFQERAEEAEENPLAGADINWSRVGEWIARLMKDRACYVEGAGWGEWTGTHWEFALQPSSSLLNAIRAHWKNANGQVAEKLNAGAKSGTTALERAQGHLTLSRHIFNAPSVAHLLAFKNTTVDLKTGKRLPHNPKHYMTGCLRANYNEKANAQRVLDAFARFWPKDPETAVMFQTSIGYSLTGEVSAKRMFFMVGNQDNALANGDNGKSLVQNALVRLFGLGAGGWGAAVKSAIIVDTGDRDANSHDGAKGPLIWRRFSMSSEFQHGASINSGEFNLLSGGDVLSARLPHSPLSVEFINTSSMWFSMNTVPRFKTWDKATKVRLTPFPFLETFHDADDCPPGGQLKELGLAEWLASDEGQESLALYAVQGAMRFYAVNGGKAGNIPDAPSVLQMRDKILATSNPYADLFEDNFVFDQAFDTKEKALNMFLRDHLQQQPRPYEKELFIRALEGMGAMKKTINGERFYRGVGLTEKAARVAREAGGIQSPCIRRGVVVNIAAE